MASIFRKNGHRSIYLFILLGCLLLATGFILTGQASTADIPPTGTETTSLQETYNQAADGDTIRAKTKIFSESLVLDRPINVKMQGGYTDNTYTTTNGTTSLHGTLAIKNGTVRVSNLTISGSSSGGLTISAVSVDVPRISWTTDQPADSRVDYGETNSYGISVSGADLTTSHSLVLTGLKPNTTYHYIVSSSTSSASAATADNTFTTSDFIAATIGDIGNSTVIEVSGNYDAKNSDGSLNTIPRQKIAQEYFKTHNDNIDFLVMLSTFDFAMPDPTTKGFYTPVKNDTQGINQPIFDNSSLFGSNGKLQGAIDMGNVTGIANNPLDSTFEGALTILSHEIMHRWGAYVTYKKPDNSISSDLLGKDGSHWSYLLDSSSSLMYGSSWVDNGDGTFTATGVTNNYSYLDLYLMGMIDKTQVPPMFLINSPAVDKTQLPQAGATVSGTATTVTIDNIIAAQGDRAPLSAQAQKAFKVGYVLLIRPGGSAGASSATVDTLRKSWAGKFAALTGTMGTILDVVPELNITLAPSLAGSTVTGPDVLVEGTLLNTTGNETGITVNNIPATVFGNYFMANHVPLQSGANTITVTATDAVGQTATTTTTVTSIAGDYARLQADIDSGLAPLSVNFTIEGSLDFTGATLNCSGPATATISANAAGTGYVASFPSEGIYSVTINATGIDGLSYQDTVKIVVISELENDRFMKQKWAGMKNALSLGNISGATSFFNEDSQATYQALFQEMSANLPEIATNMRPLELDYITKESAEYRILRTETIEAQQLEITYFIYFVKNKDGLWKINQM